MKNTRILVSAYGCEPGKGSEQGVGWHWCLELAKLAELVVFTRSNNQASIQAAIPPELRSRIKFKYFDLPSSVRRFKDKEKGFYLYYLLWQWGVYRQVKELIAFEEFDYSMHLTFGSIWLPTFLHLSRVPFIWGPIGGGEAVPFSLIRTLPLSSKIVQYARYALMAVIPINPFILNIMRRSTVILCRTEDTARLIPKRYASKVHLVLETAIASDMINRTVARLQPKGRGEIQVIYTGRLIALKNVAVAIHAAARAITRGAKLRLLIVGDGPLREDLKALANALNIAEFVEFRGFLSQEETIQLLRSSDVYLFPSLKEGGSWSLMEAMSAGLPVICVKSSGMALITDEVSAIRIEAKSQTQMIEDFSHALFDLALSPEKRRRLGDSARRRIEKDFQWGNKKEFMRALLSELNNVSSSNVS